LTPVYENDRSYFVLGNYDREPIRRLNLVVDRLNRRQDAYLFRMVDIRGEWDNSTQKFCLIGDIVTYLVGVAEVSTVSRERVSDAYSVLDHEFNLPAVPMTPV
jgi:hypothetical protein